MKGKWIPRFLVALMAIACLAATAMLTMIVLNRYAARDTPPPVDDHLQPLFEVPHFELVNQLGESFGSDELAGGPYIVNFFFTQCRDICPTMNGEMLKLQRALTDRSDTKTRMVSISIDAGHDNPEQLAAYAKRFNVDAARWMLLTGEREEVWPLIEKGFKLSVSQMDDPGQPFSHSSSFVLVDSQGQVRNYYQNMHIPKDAQRQLVRLLSDLSMILREQGEGI